MSENIIIAILGSSLLTTIVSSVVSYLSNNKAKDQLLNKGVMSLLGMEIRNKCEQAILRNSISLEELRQIQEMNAIYMEMGGNGFVRTLMHDIENLQISD